MSEAEAVPLVISSSRVVHVEGCGHVAHYVNGQRLRQFESWESEREFFNPAPGVEVMVTGQPVQTLNEKWISVRTDREKIATGGAYRRCRHCAPDVPDYEPYERIVSKRAETLVHGDIGRPGVDGIIARILHLSEAIEVTMEDGRVLQLLPDERVSFFTRVRNDAPRS